jgi:hypothetical protein
MRLPVPIVALILCHGLIVTGCGDDETGSISDSGQTSETGGTIATGNTSTDGTNTTEGDVGICEPVEYPIQGTPFEIVASGLIDVELDEECLGLSPGVPSLETYLYYPENAQGVPHPIVIMTNGAGQLASGYEHILRPLAKRGFVVASVQSQGEVVERANAVACTLRWLRKFWFPDNAVTSGCDLVLMGHSRGGEAAWIAGNAIPNIPWSDIGSTGIDMELSGLIGIASRFLTASPFGTPRALQPTTA